MRMTVMTTVVSTLLLSAAAAQAGDYSKMTKEQFTAADTDRDGSLTLAEAQANAPKLAEKFAKWDADGDGKLTATEFDAHSKAGDKSMEADEPTTPPKAE